jgi:hypothetical protein
MLGELVSKNQSGNWIQRPHPAQTNLDAFFLSLSFFFNYPDMQPPVPQGPLGGGVFRSRKGLIHRIAAEGIKAPDGTGLKMSIDQRNRPQQLAAQKRRAVGRWASLIACAYS